VGQTRESLTRCWTLLQRVWVAGDDPQYVANTLRRIEAGAPTPWTIPPLPADADRPRHPRVTIADLGTFEAATFPAKLESWCRATLEALE
jgi:hypothetical protein